MNYFAKNLRFLRILKELSQAKAASQLGFAANRWSNYETGVSTPSFDDFMKILDFFDIGATDFLTIDLENAYLNEETGREILQGKSIPKSIPKGIPNSEISGMVVSEPPTVYGLTEAEKEVKRLHRTIAALEAAVQSLSASNARHIKDIEHLNTQIERLKKEVQELPAGNKAKSA